MGESVTYKMCLISMEGIYGEEPLPLLKGKKSFLFFLVFKYFKLLEMGEKKKIIIISLKNGENEL